MKESIMETIGSFKAKTHWSALLDKVALGQEIIITKRGKPVARLIPEIIDDNDDINRAIEDLKTLRKGVTLEGISWKALRDEGRL
ncbi:type II toxin-antitoxin system prevent-host-death family antitoxin [Gilvibacter sp.]|uniref:type II toxin-antitoxin system Phd/YefM family antitoxin n=1 Tax=Gilvibacter sp. TaxID=2729997 RepID=UPI0025C290E3|nr:type II toxin-antitoxin system prevent-host-death family antitoxin [Gilvibacter sp.]